MGWFLWDRGSTVLAACWMSCTALCAGRRAQQSEIIAVSTLAVPAAVWHVLDV